MMSFPLSRPDSTEPTGTPAETEPAKDAAPAEDAPDAPDARNTGTALDAPEVQAAEATGPDIGAGRARPSFQPRHTGEAASTPASFTGPPEDDSLEGPLLPDATQLQGNWQRILSSFIDDPHGSVAEAAALVDHAAQALAGALQQRQRRLRESWDVPDGGSRDTEQLRVTMQRYRTLFNHICRP